MRKQCTSRVTESGQVLSRQCLRKAQPGRDHCYTHSAAGYNERQRRRQVEFQRAMARINSTRELFEAKQQVCTTLIKWLHGRTNDSQLRKVARRLERAEKTA